MDFANVPCAYDQAAAVRIRFDLRNDVVDLVDRLAVRGSPVAPLCTVDATQIAVFVGPLVPNGNTIIVQEFDIGVAAQEPKQFVYDGFEVQLLVVRTGNPSCRGNRAWAPNTE